MPLRQEATMRLRYRQSRAGMTNKFTRSHEAATIERKDRQFTAECLNPIIEEGDEAEISQTLQRFSKAFGE